MWSSLRTSRQSWPGIRLWVPASGRRSVEARRSRPSAPSGRDEFSPVPPNRGLLAKTVRQQTPAPDHSEEWWGEVRRSESIPREIRVSCPGFLWGLEVGCAVVGRRAFQWVWYRSPVLLHTCELSGGIGGTHQRMLRADVRRSKVPVSCRRRPRPRVGPMAQAQAVAPSLAGCHNESSARVPSRPCADVASRVGFADGSGRNAPAWRANPGGCTLVHGGFVAGVGRCRCCGPWRLANRRWSTT